jgi:hypothetical protein
LCLLRCRELASGLLPVDFLKDVESSLVWLVRLFHRLCSQRGGRVDGGWLGGLLLTLTLELQQLLEHRRRGLLGRLCLRRNLAPCLWLGGRRGGLGVCTAARWWWERHLMYLLRGELLQLLNLEDLLRREFLHLLYL